MRLTVYTDYSLRVLLYLGVRDCNELTTIQEIADNYNISKNHLMKVTYELGKLGYIETIRGRGGGIRLAKDPQDIVIGQVVRQTEDDFHIVECFNPESNLCILSPECKLKFALQQALQAYVQVLDQYTLADCIVSKDAMRQLLGLNNN
ncbi:MAG: Rrf2 family transcriptional regulator [Lysinibacillus sp.]